jgi:phospholipase A1/A2
MHTIKFHLIKFSPEFFAGCLLAAFTFPAVCLAEDNWLIAAQTESFDPAHAIQLEAVKPDGLAAWPDSLRLKLSGNGIDEEIQLIASKPATGARRLYSGSPSKQFSGVVRAELAGHPSNRLAMLAGNEGSANPVQIAETVAVPSTVPPGKKPAAIVLVAKPGDEPPLSANDPTYFLFGSSSEHGADAKFQLSFKYRPFDPKGSIAETFPLLSNLYFGYTQTTIWDLGGNSSPFRDTSYRPSVYYRWLADDGNGLLPEEWRAGLEHESNGQGGVDSRSINTAFFQPTWHIDLDNGRRLSLMPKFYNYLEKSDNDDIQRYRGYADWRVRYGREDGLIVDGLYRQGTGGYTTGQVDVSYPVSDRIFGRTGTFVHLQLFSGYGETLLDYNRDGDTQLRVGISLSR